MKKSFLNSDKSILTLMVQADNPERTKSLMDKGLSQGAEAFGMQLEKFFPEYKNKEIYKELFSYTDKPVYVTNYRNWKNEGKSDDILAEEMLEIAGCGPTLCDVMGDLFDKQDDEVARDEEAIKKQMEYIEKLHEKGAEVLMSSHTYKFVPAERVLEMALEHQRRGADISKIVTGADDTAQEIENLRIINLLKEKLEIPFLFISSGASYRVLRRIGGEFGNCMTLCVCEYDNYATVAQPLLTQVKAIRENMGE
ncbi:MAG: type I 3-dehydroquinate dehydratase [Clostridia bacterium]|nr:type I 3-dehydroquinate dehydratase [Clostridia bacterium]